MTVRSASTGAGAIRSLIVATDFGAEAAPAFEHGLALALALRADLTIVHVTDDANADVPWQRFPPVRQTLARWGLLPADTAKEAVAAALGIRVRKVTTVGKRPLDGMLDFLAAHPTHLLVMTTAGRRGLGALLHPSVAAGIARHARLSTLFLPPSTRGFVSAGNGAIALRRVLVPVDTTPLPLSALECTRGLAEQLDAGPFEIEVLHVGSHARLTNLVPPDDDLCRWRFLNEQGEAGTCITAAAGHADLIVMTTAGRRGAADAILGSTAERVLKTAPCPVLTVPAVPP